MGDRRTALDRHSVPESTMRRGTMQDSKPLLSRNGGKEYDFIFKLS